MNKQSGNLYSRQVLGAHARWIRRRVQRIRGEQQSGGEIGKFRSQHGALAAPIGMSADVKPACHSLFQAFNGSSQSFAITGRFPRTRRSEGTLLPVGQITTEHGPSRFGQCVGQCDQERSLRIGARAVCKNQTSNRCPGWKVQKSTHRRIGAVVYESFWRRDTHEILKGNFFQSFVHFDNGDLVGEPCPAAQCGRVFLRLAAGCG